MRYEKKNDFYAVYYKRNTYNLRLRIVFVYSLIYIYIHVLYNFILVIL